MTEDFAKFLKASREGRLKVYLGMAAGVGKTVAMLREAKRLRAEGIDVVSGIIEPHGREETLAEIGDLEVIPRKVIHYKGVPLEEMDTDAILARRPDLVLVDELAHTCVPGGRHDKRYQDVDDLLDAGISVMGTLNVQHLESLHDLVLRETSIDVRERVPDRFLHRADEIVVVDLAPEELQERLRQGKIYPPEKVERALAAFFRADKLAALRQLALREVANAVELRARARVQATRPNGDAEPPEVRGVAAPALRRAQAVSPLDAEVMALWALLAELEGRDADANRGYRAVIALRDAEDTPAPDPHEGLARLRAYSGARPAEIPRSLREGACFWVVTEPVAELGAPSPAGDSPCIAIMALGLVAEGPAALFYRDGEGPRSFALMAGAMRPESLASALGSLGPGPIVVTDGARAQLDLPRIDALRLTAKPPGGP